MTDNPRALLTSGLVFGSVFVLLFYGTIETMVGEWASDDNYSHGFIIPLVSAYLVWNSWDKIRSVPMQTSWPGLGVMVAGLLIFLGGLASEIDFAARIGMLLVFGGTLLYTFGSNLCRAVWFPYLFLFFMVPLPYVLYDNIAFPLKLFITKFSVGAVKILGIPVLREGNIIHLANTTLEVADACSGIRSIVSLLALGVALAWFTQRGWVKMALLVIMVIPIAILTNALRVIGTAALASRFGPEVAHGFYHEFAGLAIFAAAFGLLLLASVLLKKIEVRHHD